MIGLFITIFILAWKLTLIILGLIVAVVILSSSAYGVLWILGAILEHFGIKTYQKRKPEQMLTATKIDSDDNKGSRHEAGSAAEIVKFNNKDIDLDEYVLENYESYR